MIDHLRAFFEDECNILADTKMAKLEQKQSVIKLTSLTIRNLATPNAGAKHEPLSKKLSSDVGLLNIQL
jgi:hypothetical protein